MCDLYVCCRGVRICVCVCIWHVGGEWVGGCNVCACVCRL